MWLLLSVISAYYYSRTFKLAVVHKMVGVHFSSPCQSLFNNFCRSLKLPLKSTSHKLRKSPRNCLIFRLSSHCQIERRLVICKYWHLTKGAGILIFVEMKVISQSVFWWMNYHLSLNFQKGLLAKTLSSLLFIGNFHNRL